MVRLALMSDLDRILDIYESARTYMKIKGNPTQWGDSYPELLMLLQDLTLNQLFVIEENDKVIGCFVLTGGEDETYQVIDDGQWRSDKYYGTIHRIASDGSGAGIFSTCMEYAKEHYDYLRVDTHADNLPMQRAMLKNGFERCGMIKTYDGTDRLAFARPAELWIPQDEQKRRRLLAASLGLYGAAMLLAAGLIADVIFRTGSGWLLLALLALLALPCCLLILTRLRKDGGIGIGPDGIKNRLAERALHGSYAWSELAGAEFGPKEKTVELRPKDPDAFFAALPRRTRKALRQKRLKNDTLPLSCLLLTKRDKDRLLHLIQTGLEARKETE